MNRRGLVVLLLALLGCEAKREAPPAAQPDPPAPPTAAPAPSIAASTCGDDETLTDEGIGHLRIASTVEAVGLNCTIVRDTTAIGAEGMPARKLLVALSQDTVEAEVVSGRVWRIAVASSRLRTADSLGVGTTKARLLQLTKPRLMTGEGRLFVASPEHCGMSFRLAKVGRDALRGNRDRVGLARLPDTAVVSEVLIFGCRLPAGPG
ncbi:MAG TPA: hypothetical protein VKB91_05330 [Gemmatimonadaceae bacterium]|nr:hypothetical protein [Gemmatimonadaceae bacterium]